MRYLAISCAAIALSLLIGTGCNRPATPTEDETFRIGFVVTTLSNPYFVEMTEAAQAQADEYENLELIIQAPETASDNERQIQIIENLIVQGVDAICVVPANSESIVAAVLRANEAGIPILIIDNRMDEDLARERGATAVTFIGSDNYEGGVAAGEYVASRLDGQGQVAVLEGVAGVDAAIQRRSGFADAVGESPGIEIVASQTANWSREEGLNVFQNILQANPGIDALFASNDEMGLGAVQAIRQAGRTGDIVVVGFDATDDGLAAVEEGVMDATVAQLPGLMGRLAVRNAWLVLQDEQVSSEIPIPVQILTSQDLRRAPADSVLSTVADSLAMID